MPRYVTMLFNSFAARDKISHFAKPVYFAKDEISRLKIALYICYVRIISNASYIWQERSFCLDFQ